MAASSNRAIYGAILANVAIAGCKFIAAFFTGSSAMFSEGIHSLVDTGNGFLLLVGIRRSKKLADDIHPFGYGQLEIRKSRCTNQTGDYEPCNFACLLESSR